MASAKPHWPSPQQLSTPGMDGARAEVQLALPGGLVVAPASALAWERCSLSDSEKLLSCSWGHSLQREGDLLNIATNKPCSGLLAPELPATLQLGSTVPFNK